MNIKGIGTDIISNTRVKNSDVNDRFLSEKEKEVYKNIGSDGKNNFLSGRWAAKEAIIKASNKEFIFSDISIINSPTGKPFVFIGNIKRIDIHLSISHDVEYTIAFCVIEKV